MTMMLSALAAALAIPLMMGMAHRAKPTLREDGFTVLRYHWSIGILGLALAAITVFMVVLLLRETGPISWGLAGTVIPGIGALSSYFVSEWLRSYVAFNGHSLEYRSTFTRLLHFEWSEIETVEYSTVNRWLVLRLKSGKTVRVSHMFIGIKQFWALLREKVDPTLWTGAERTFRESE